MARDKGWRNRNEWQSEGGRGWEGRRKKEGGGERWWQGEKGEDELQSEGREEGMMEGGMSIRMRKKRRVHKSHLPISSHA